jgi:hypothetical protein
MLTRATTRPRRRALGLVLFVVVATASACASHRSETIACLPDNPYRPSDYAAVFATRNLWSGGDGAVTVDLLDGRTLWLFGDTFVDGLDASGRPTGQFLNNSIVVQHGRCFSMIGEGGPRQRQSVLRASAPGMWLWPQAGVVDPTGYVRIIALRMAEAPGPVGWNWRVDGLDIATLSLASLAWVSTTPAPLPPETTAYLGGSVATVGADVYFYPTVGGRRVLAHTTTTTLASAPWEFYTAVDPAWTTDPDGAADISFSGAPGALISVLGWGGGFLASALDHDVIGTRVLTWFSATPYGPFAPLGTATTVDTPPGWYPYGGRVTWLPGAGPVTVWSQNSDPASSITDMRPYGPRFATPNPSALPVL